MQNQQQRLSVVEKVGYSLGDAAAAFVFMTMVVFQQKFYTDVFLLEPKTAALVLLVGRLWDAFFDPVMGVVAERTHTRWGKFRPWILWTALPWGVCMYLAYTRPNLSGASLVIYAAVTNLALMTIYSANNTPYSAMTAVMTGDGRERTVLSSYRFFAAMIAQLIVGGFTLPLVAKFGQGDAARGWQTTMGLWALICVGLFVITFLTTRERIQPPPTQTSSHRDDFGNLLKNRAWIVMFLFTMAHFIVLAMRGGNMQYYFDYYLDRDALLSFLKGLGMPTEAPAESFGFGSGLLDKFGLVLNADGSNAASVGFSLFNMSSQFILLVGVLASAALAQRFGKKAVAVTGFTLAAVFMALFLVAPGDKIWVTYALEWSRALFYGPTVPLLWAMFADVVDFGEWKLGRRSTGVIYATILFALKVGLSLGGAISLWLLQGYGYHANVAQPTPVLTGIRMLVSIYPAMLFVVCFGCLVAYPINKRMNEEMQQELDARRRLAT